MKKCGMIALVLAAAVSMAACSTQTSADEQKSAQSAEETGNTIQEASRDIFAMDTYMTVTAYGSEAEAAVDAAEQEICRIENLVSTGKSTSEIGMLNAGESGNLSKDAAYLVERSLEICESTEGAFDITIYPVMRAWGFTTQEYRVPETSELEQLLNNVDSEKIQFDAKSGEISFSQEGMEIDLGGIAKGYTSAKIMDIFREYEIESGMVSLGGNVQVYGSKTDGSPWRVAVENPDVSGDYIGVLSVTDRAVITSGGYERYFEEDGKSYHHIIDPATGYPADSGLVSVTIVSSDGTLADGLSTALFIMGKDKAAAYWQENSAAFDAVLVDEEGMIYVTEGIRDLFETEHEVTVIEE